MDEAFVAAVSIALILVPLVLLVYGIARAARHTAEAGSSLFGVLGVLLALVGLIGLLWTQLNFDHRLVRDPAASRWDVATGPLVVIALGLLVCVGAQILRAVQERNAHDADEHWGAQLSATERRG